MRYLIGRPVTLSHAFAVDDDVAPTPANVTVRIERRGTTVSQGPAEGPTEGVYTYTATGLAMGPHVAVWSGEGYEDRVTFEVTGSVLFTVPEARKADENLTPARFGAAELAHYRHVVESEFERITGRSFVDRVVPVHLEVTDEATEVPLLDVRALEALYGPDGAVDVSGAHLDPYGRVSGLVGLANGTYEAEVRYGMAEVPADVKRVGIIRLRTLLTADRTGVPDRATSFTASEGGTFTLATAGRGGYETGIPEVDATLSRYTFAILRDVIAHGQ